MQTKSDKVQGNKDYVSKVTKCKETRNVSAAVALSNVQHHLSLSRFTTWLQTRSKF